MATIAAPATPATFLTNVERQLLHDLCRALLPRLAPEPADDPALFRLGADDVGVGPAVEHTIGLLGPEERRQFRRLLRVVDAPLLNLVMVGKPRRFGKLSPDDREKVLRRLATSRWGRLRTAFQAVKRLAAFVFYSLPDAGGGNPAWPALHYTPSSAFPAAPAALVLTSVSRPTTLEADACVIGSGAGGGVAAAELAAAGKRVIVLEAGSGQQTADFTPQEFAGVQRLYLDRGLTTTRDLGVQILAGATVGGGTVVNWQTSLATPDAVRDEWADVSGCRHFAEDSFSRSLEAVMTRLHVTESESQLNRNNGVLRQGCDALGYRWTTIRRNARGCDPGQCGHCIFGCRHGGKQSTAVTYLADAQRLGDTVILPNCRAERVCIIGGRVTGVEAVATADNGQAPAVRVHAPAVVVAAGALHSPALLLRSGVRLPALGRNLYLHPTTAVAGVYDELVQAWSGPPQTVLCDEFAGLSGNYGFRLETAPAHPGMMGLATPWFDARSHRRLMQQVGFTSVIIALVRDRIGGRVRLGKGGRPVIDYRPGAQERDHLRRGMQTAVRVHLAAGAREVGTLHTREHRLGCGASLAPAAVDDFCRRLADSTVDRNWSLLFSAHQMGTCRMGRDPRTAVCDADGEVFGVRGLFVADASAFPASSGVNPMITIMALAHHTARRIKAR
ncbi:MAG TPA: GMC family oxidoreductase [Gemmataceae bacterium]|jgi:choline dehydrogenase-like flavoprotein|nr:GMC family oxidoreductase [Gemmataceae bacterium]